MMTRKWLKVRLVRPWLIPCIALAACQPEPSAQQNDQPTAQIPKEVCETAEESLNTATKKVGLILGEGSTASLEQSSWQALDGSAREALMNAIAIRSACTAAEPPGEIQVQVKNEFGVTLASQWIPLQEMSGSMSQSGNDPAAQP